MRFQTAFVRKVYRPPVPVAAEVVRTQAGYMAPEVFTAAPMSALPSATESVVAPLESSDVVLGADGQPIREIDASIKSLREQIQVAVHQMWLPPLEPLPVDELVRRLRRKPWFEDYGNTADFRCRWV